MLNYRIYGELSAGQTPLIVMHGLLGEMDNWRTFSRKQQEERPIIAIDMRNHGESPHEAGMGYQLMTDDVLEVLDLVGILEVLELLELFELLEVVEEEDLLVTYIVMGPG